MELFAVIEVDEPMATVARYVMETFAQWLGAELRVVNRALIPEGEPFVAYTAIDNKIAQTEVRIVQSQDARGFFAAKSSAFPVRSQLMELAGEAVLNAFADELSQEAIWKSGVGYIRKVDIIANVFYFLSGWQEVFSRERDGFDRFPAQSSLQAKFDLLHVPVVNQYFSILERWLAEAGFHAEATRRPFGEAEFALCFTHDVDYLQKWTKGIIYREVVEYFLLNERKKKLADRVQRLSSFLRSAKPSADPYRVSLQQLLDAEEAKGISATYFLKTGVSDKRDVRYSLRRWYGKTLLEMLQHGTHEIGLHPSFRSYKDHTIMAEEKHKLERLVGSVKGVRQHYLRLSIPSTWRIQDSLGFLYDATGGFADHEGFRFGYAGVFRVFDIDTWKPMKLLELPLLAMDGTFQSYRHIPPEHAFSIIHTLIDSVKRYRGAAALLFHNTIYDTFDYAGWGDVFEATVSVAKDMGAYIAPCHSVVERWVQS